ncbi:hypothetical protein GIB67_010283 [Kingdonia uniflora]|uniref:Uncharacterized protein n=1 Tax=Kingdonia uniflora TaxID=39325 RepID=A0A7J7M9P3_9MAGN|nr:hypothetical protein GIB67_010283 [Kingdonia uniflora]
MDRHYGKKKPSRKNRDDRERNRDHTDRDRDRKHRSNKDDRVREPEEKNKNDKYREDKHSSKDDKHIGVRESEEKSYNDKYREDKHSLKDDKHRGVRESEEKNYINKYREEKHSSKDDKHRDGDRHHQSRNYSETQPEKSNELPNTRESSRDDRGLREESVEKRSSPSRSSHKRKQCSDSEEQSLDKSEKRSRGLKEEKREKIYFGGKALEERRDGRKIENDNKEYTRVANDVTSREERRERRRFGDRPKEDDLRDLEEEKQRGSVTKLEIKEGAHEQDSVTFNGSGPIANDAGMETLNMKSSGKTSSAHNHQSHPTKVSSISTTNENKGVNVTRSHEVPGKSSTDGTTTSAAGKSGSLSLDAIAKAKKVLQMQKELSEKLKKIPLLNKVSASKTNGTTQVEANKQVSGPSSLNIGTQHGPQSLIIGVPNIEAVKRAQELAAKMGFHHDPEFAPIINMFPGQMSVDVTLTQKPAKAPVLRIDSHGREVDEHGNIINLPKLTNLSTLKVNINKQKKDAFQMLKPELDVDPDSNPHFDANMGINKEKLLRPKRMSFQFVEEGKWSKDAEIIKFKSQFGEAQAKELKTKQAQLAKAKAGLDINPNFIEVAERDIFKEKPKDPIPEIEWWDAPLLLSGTYADVDITEKTITEDKLKMDKITIYVEHPLPIDPPAEPAPPAPQPLKLTKKEQKKLRTQRRLGKEKDRQEMIRQGLIEPPKPKIKMSNLMKILGSEATQDPTRLEMEVRNAAADREQAHVDRNIARKLTPAERREKKEKKLFEDSNTVETIVSVYKVNDLSHPQTRFKVDVNAQENRLTGSAVLSEGISVVVVEGGSKPIKRYGKLMLNRINWAAAVSTEDDMNETEEKPVNKCVLVWQGSVAKPSFYKFHVHQCRTEAAARKVFSDAGVAHYWDLVANFKDEQE